MRTLAMLVCLAALTLPTLAGCGGSPSTPGTSTPSAVVQSAPSAASTPPQTVVVTGPTCAGQGYQGGYPACICPQPYQTYVGATGAVAGTCIGNPPPTTPPAPPVPPPPPTMSLTYQAQGSPASSYDVIWTSTGAQQCAGAAGFPLNGVLPPAGQVNTLALSVTTSYLLVCTGPGGNATASITITVATSPPPASPPPPGAPPPPTCAVPDILIGALCEAPPVLELALSLNPPTVADDRAGCPAPDGTTCTATVNLNATSNLPGTIVCQDPTGNDIFNVDGWSTDPYGPLQDGAHVLTFTCWQYGIPVSQSITLTVVRPGAPPAPTFACALNGNTLACDWQVFGTQGCSVELFDSPGTQWVLVPGGTASGSAVSGFLSPAYDPWTATLYCGGVPAPGVSTITVSP